MAADCPDETTLFDYVQGVLSPGARSELMPHFERCQICEQLVARLSESMTAEPVALKGDGATERFVLEERLGSGGGGDVYRAHDQRLQRTVAIKLLRSGERRFLIEAQAQARVEHPNICKVFEIGMLGDRPFIAMQYVAGRTIGDAAGDMTFVERLRVLAQVAGAVAAAHAHGIVHRDLKPSNIMVERGADGEWKPYVMDFGLARDVSGDGVTETGAVVGTPMYMAPEQARGESRLIDPRTDVFGLGVTSYCVLTGRAPFVARSAPEALLAVLQLDPIPPRRIEPRFPADVQTILLKCLEKDPARRYDSAAALVGDFERYLRGESISALPVGLVGRWARSTRRQPRRVVAIALALATAATLGTLALQARRNAAVRAELWNQLGQKVPQLRAALRSAYLLPTHDVRPERQRVRAEMQEVEAELGRSPDRATVALIEYVLGEGHLALGEDERALELLQKAAAAGRRGPDLDAALGRALASRYEHELETAQRLGDSSRRARRLREIETRYRDPALAHLRAAVGAVDASPAYLEALMLYQQQRYADAVTRAHAAFAAAPTEYETGLIEAKAQLGLAGDAWNAGQQAEADRHFAAAQDVFVRVLEIARSDDHVYLEKADALLEQAVCHSDRGDLSEELTQPMHQAIAEALRIDPDNVSALSNEAFFYAKLAWIGLRQNVDIRAKLKKASSLADQVLARNPGDADAYSARCTALSMEGRFQQHDGSDPTDTYDRAIAACKESLRLKPESSKLSQLGYAFSMLAAYQGSVGIDPEATFAASLSSYRDAIALSGDSTHYNNLAVVYSRRADYDVKHDRDPSADIEAGLDAFRTALRLDRALSSAESGSGELQTLRGTYAAVHGADPRPFFVEAKQAFSRSLAINPTLFGPQFKWFKMLLVEAAYLVEHDQDPRLVLADARSRFEALDRALPHDAWVRSAHVGIALVAARWQLRRGVPAQALDGIDGELTRMCDPSCTDADYLTLAAEVQVARAADARAQHRSPAAAIAQGVALAERALRVDPLLTRARKVSAALAQLKAVAP